MNQFVVTSVRNHVLTAFRAGRDVKPVDVFGAVRSAQPDLETEDVIESIIEGFRLAREDRRKEAGELLESLGDAFGVELDELSSGPSVAEPGLEQRQTARIIKFTALG